MKVKVSNIVYDTDDSGSPYGDSELNLPSKMDLVLRGDNAVEDEIADTISDLTGWCVQGYTYEIEPVDNL